MRGLTIHEKYVWKIWSMFASMINVYHISPLSIYVLHIDVYIFVNMLWCVHIVDMFILIHAKNINHQSQAQENKQKRNHFFYECDPLELRGFLWLHVSVHCHQAWILLRIIYTHHRMPFVSFASGAQQKFGTLCTSPFPLCPCFLEIVGELYSRNMLHVAPDVYEYPSNKT